MWRKALSGLSDGRSWSSSKTASIWKQAFFIAVDGEPVDGVALVTTGGGDNVTDGTVSSGGVGYGVRGTDAGSTVCVAAEFFIVVVAVVRGPQAAATRA